MYRAMIIIGTVCIYTTAIPSEPGPPELPNPKKETCYMNAVLQCLYNLSELRNLLLSPSLPAIQGDSILPPLIQTLKYMEQYSSLKQYSDFVTQCKPGLEQALGGGWQDSVEFVSKIYEAMTENSYLRNDIQQLLKIPGGTGITEFTLDIIPLNLTPNKTTSLQRDLSTNYNMGNITPLTQVPRYLAITWSLDYPGLETPRKAVLNEYITLAQPSQAQENDITILSENADYTRIPLRLNSTSIFQGVHYTAYVRRGNQWWHCDDDTVNKSSLVTEWNPSAKFPYLLFYEHMPEHPSPQEIKNALEALYKQLHVLYNATSSVG